jgi:two-component system chemotaxis response regulator CheB
MVNVLVVEDSGVARELIKHILTSDPDIRVIGTACNGEEALEFLKTARPDVITMDIIMPKMDGYEATRRIMETNPLPIVIVSASLVREEVERTWKAVEAGAVAVLEKPRLSEMGNPTGEAAKLIQTVKLMAQVKVVRRWRRSASTAKSAVPQAAGVQTTKAVASATATSAALQSRPKQEVKAVAIGASTGGPQALLQIFSRLPASFPVPLFLVQHISPGFTSGFVDWLNRSTPLEMRLPADCERARPGFIYTAPDGVHMRVDAGGRIRLTDDPPVGGIRPAVAALFASVVKTYGARSVGVLLTGMGRDGAEEMKALRDVGAITIAQDEESCIVYGMPAEAVKLGGAKYSLNPDKIAEMLIHLVK